ncbi:hypothetical protein FJ422_29665 [Mesorhizobium sp. B2-6-3]|uniref:putative Ig domain-containing protein n=1 Tax=Mesorhizobium sp. B2-6-3 TaxID=2589914 RepID=UPI00112E77B1|nr:putative Ig domain-containing protein [Mesorhizobium sp. B2-6-3]TPJ76878.1 hypothetical protein FJ422_29665 [Mesorhizobium sp. B2-6-3]
MTAMQRTFRNRVRPWWWWRRLADRLRRIGLAVVAAPVTTAQINVAYAGFTAAATQGFKPYAFSASGFPAGVVIDADTGEVSGTPTESGSFSVVITVTDADGRTATLPFTLEVSA